MRHVGVEPSGNAFNAIVVDPHTNRPFNPMVNAGAIVTTGLLRGGSHRRPPRTRSSAASAATPVASSTSTRPCTSPKRSTGDRNRAIGYLMASFGMLAGDVEPSLDLYFRQCALTVTCRDLAAMAATLANRGVNPVTGERALGEPYVQNVLSVMETCGLYDYAGEWAFTVGLPAKSGVSGGIVAVLPGQFGIGVFSPRLDARGNSVRAIKVCQRLAAEYSLHPFRFQPVVRIGRPALVPVPTSVRSNRHRPTVEYDALARLGDAVAVLELQGDLFFGSTELLYRRVLDGLDGVEYVVLDFRRVTGVDQAARTDPRPAPARAATTPAARWSSRTATPREASNQLVPRWTRRFADIDSALEWCENELLAAAGAVAPEPAPELAAQELLPGLSPDELAGLTAVLDAARGGRGRDDLPQRATSPTRCASCSRVRSRCCCRSTATAAPAGWRPSAPAWRSGRWRSSTRAAAPPHVVADCDSVVVELPIAAFVEPWRRGEPHLARTLYANLARNLSHRVRSANGQLRALEQ